MWVEQDILTKAFDMFVDKDGAILIGTSLAMPTACFEYSRHRVLMLRGALVCLQRSRRTAGRWRTWSPLAAVLWRSRLTVTAWYATPGLMVDGSGLTCPARTRSVMWCGTLSWLP